MSYSGKFKPKNYKKYKGDPTKIYYRSLWERRFMVYCDNNPNIIEWGSEEIIIPYRSPVDKKVHRYFPDFYIKYRNNSGEVKREIIEVRSVETKVLKKNIGYLRLKWFNSNSSKQLIDGITKFEKKDKPKSYILDLRNNPGGLLTQAINVADFFLDDGEIVSTRGRRNSENRRFFAKKGDKLKGKPLIILINNGSASASEIVAGALRDHKRAILLGESTYGKGSVQSVIPLTDGGGMRLTISKYYLPSGKSISEVGVKPDIIIEEETEDFRIDTNSDNQLNYAIKLLTT